MSARRIATLSLALIGGMSIGAQGQTGAAKAATATGLAPGQAKGTLTVNGQPVTLGYAYADLEENPFDAKKNDIVLLLTDQPVPQDVLAREELGGLPGAAETGNVKNYLRIKFREAEGAEKRSERAILGAWVVGHRTISHQILKGKSLQVSPDFSVRVTPVALGKDRVEGVLSTDGPQSFPHDDKYEFRVSFNASVKPRKAAPTTEARVQPKGDAPPDLRNGQRLPAGGGAPGKAYLAYNEAMRKGDLEGLKRTDSSFPAGSAAELEQIKKMLPLLASMAPPDLKIIDGVVEGDKAVLTVEGTRMGEKKKGTAEMALTGGVWKLVKDTWK